MPQEVNFIDDNPIPLSDGIVLSATTWMPVDAADKPVPAILEYLPYRKKDATAKQDALNHPYVAAHGYACVRLDMRGSGDSGGLLLGEYLQQEQDDALEILQWIASQRWCTGSIGMIGYSWGGFNGLQVAARQPAQLKAIISICSTDDRYRGDVHYMGGCLLVDNFTWGASMFAIVPTPPDPSVVGDGWREQWLARLESGGTYLTDWHEKQTRGEFWQHASICEDYSTIRIPVYLIGGWADPYHESLFRMLENLHCPRKGLVGPWGHEYPNLAQPGPQIGFLQESIRWWDQWLKGKSTGIMEEPMLRTYMQETVAPRRQFLFRPGHWMADPKWPSPRIELHRLALSEAGLTTGPPIGREHLSIRSPQTVGLAAGKWLVFGTCPDGPGDQRSDGDGSLLFDTDVQDGSWHILGAPVLALSVASDKPNALVAATLSEVLPDGSTTRISYGLLNLTHRESDSNPTPLSSGTFYDVTVKMNECGQHISDGSRLRLALSTSYFPIVWPSPEAATITIDCTRSRIDIPVRKSSHEDAKLKPFQPAENAAPLSTEVLREEKQMNLLTTDLDSGVTTVRYDNDGGAYMNSNTKWCYGTHETVVYSIHPNDPLSARVEQRFRNEYGLGRPNLVIAGWLRMHATMTHFHITARMEAFEDNARVFDRDYCWAFTRNLV